MKLYTSAAWLKVQLKSKTPTEIAQMCGVDTSTINRQIKKLGIR